MILIAVWLKNQDPAEPPSHFYWADGSAATEEDYVRHIDHTYTLIGDPDGSVQKLIFPELWGEAFYDTRERVWTVRTRGETLQMDLEDPFANDHDIVAAMSSFPIVYSLKIIRMKQTQTLH